MHFPTRIQPADSIQSDAVKPAVLKSRLKRLFDRPFNGVLRASAVEKPPATGGEKDSGLSTAAAAEFEPSSVCLDKLVRNFIEDGSEKQSAVPAEKYGRNRLNCFSGNSNDSSDDELDFFSDSLSANSSFSDPAETLKSLIPCASVAERNMLADTSKIVEKKSKIVKQRDDLRKIVADGLVALGYDASVYRSKWEKSPSIPAGEYEYIGVMINGEWVLIDLDFRSQFEIARSTSSYKAILQILPQLFVGKLDRLLQIVSVATEAARQSLKKKGMHIAPWRRSEYVKSKWLSPHTRLPQIKSPPPLPRNDQEPKPEFDSVLDGEVGELSLIFSEDTWPEESESATPTSPATPMSTWQLPAVKPKSLEKGNKAVVSGLASLLKEKP